jgi:hypothetical protein
LLSSGHTTGNNQQKASAETANVAAVGTKTAVAAAAAEADCKVAIEQQVTINKKRQPKQWL